MKTAVTAYRWLIWCTAAALFLNSAWAADPALSPLLNKGQEVDWWFVFKFNTASFPACGGAERHCIFDDHKPFPYPSFGQQYVYASSEEQTLQKGNDCLGDTTSDPVGATFDRIYNGPYFYVIWNDKFDDHPKVSGSNRWAHSKGMIAWTAAGEGLALQVSTPSWPGAGSRRSRPLHSPAAKLTLQWRDLLCSSSKIVPLE